MIGWEEKKKKKGTAGRTRQRPLYPSENECLDIKREEIKDNVKIWLPRRTRVGSLCHRPRLFHLFERLVEGIGIERQRTWLTSDLQLLPPHLHEEIDSASYFAQPRSQAPHHPPPPPHPLDRSSPIDIHGKPRSVPPPIQPPQLPPLATTPPSGGPPPFQSRGPSPILPPLRDLQTTPERFRERPMTAYDDSMSTRSQFQTPPAYLHRASSDRDRFDYGLYNRPASGGAGGPPTYGHGIYDNRRYTPYSSSYASESEYSPATQSAPASSFGVMGDSMDSRGKRRRGNLPKPVTDILRAWFHEHLDHPYPTEEDKQMFMSRTGLSISQVSSPTLFKKEKKKNSNINGKSRSATGLSTRGVDNSLHCETSFATKMAAIPTKGRQHRGVTESAVLRRHPHHQSSHSDDLAERLFFFFFFFRYMMSAVFSFVLGPYTRRGPLYHIPY